MERWKRTNCVRLFAFHISFLLHLNTVFEVITEHRQMYITMIISVQVIYLLILKVPSPQKRNLNGSKQFRIFEQTEQNENCLPDLASLLKNRPPGKCPD